MQSTVTHDMHVTGRRKRKINARVMEVNDSVHKMDLAALSRLLLGEEAGFPDQAAGNLMTFTTRWQTTHLKNRHYPKEKAYFTEMLQGAVTVLHGIIFSV